MSSAAQRSSVEHIIWRAAQWSTQPEWAGVTLGEIQETSTYLLNASHTPPGVMKELKNPVELAFSLPWLQQTGTFSLISVCLMLEPRFVWLRSYWQRAEAAVMCSSLLMWICSCYHSTEYDGAFSSYTASISLHFLPLFYHLLLIISKQDKIQFNLKIVWGLTRFSRDLNMVVWGQYQ